MYLLPYPCSIGPDPEGDLVLWVVLEGDDRCHRIGLPDHVETQIWLKFLKHFESR